MIDGLETADALRLVGVGSKAWQKVIERGDYSEAPKTQQGKARRYVRDDVIAMAVFGQLTDLSVHAGHAARIASAVRARMRANDKISALYIVKVFDPAGNPRVEVVDVFDPATKKLFDLPIAKWRRDWAAKIRELIAERDAEIS